MKRLILATAAVAALSAFAGGDLSLTSDQSASLVASAQARYDDADFGRFYRPLKRYGRWVSYGRYGLVWVPRRSMVYDDWRPYTDGRWTYTDDSGWLWISYEPWGWATYHYGSWGFSQRLGWYWVPGYVWAPAWVSWRYGPEYIGWAPLPPEAVWGDRFNWFFSISTGYGRDYDYDRFDPHYDDRYPVRYYDNSWCFVPRRRISESRMRTVIVEREQHTTIINNTTIVNNYTVVNQTVVNRGVDIQQVDRFAERPIQRVKINAVDESPAETASTDRRELAEQNEKAVDTGTVQIFRPVEVPVQEKDGAPQLGREAQTAVNEAAAETVTNKKEFTAEEVVKPEEIKQDEKAVEVTATDAPPLPETAPTTPAAETQPSDQPAADQPKADEQPSDAKPEDKPADAKPEDKPADAKPEDKPADAKSEDKPADAKSEDKPADAKSEDKPADAKQKDKPADAKSEDDPPSDDQPSQAQPSDQPAPDAAPAETPTEREPTNEPSSDSPPPPTESQPPADTPSSEPSDQQTEPETQPEPQAEPAPPTDTQTPPPADESKKDESKKDKSDKEDKNDNGIPDDEE